MDTSHRTRSLVCFALLGTMTACVLPHAHPPMIQATDVDVPVVTADDTTDMDAVDVVELDIPNANESDGDVLTVDATDVFDAMDAQDSGIRDVITDSVDVIDTGIIPDTGVVQDVPNVICGMGMFNCGGGCRRVEGMVNRCSDANNDGVYVITAGGTPWCTTCRDLGGGGRWTMVLRANGSAMESPQPQRFGYDSPLWTNEETYNEAGVTPDEHDFKGRGFMTLSFKEIMLQMFTPTDAMMPQSLYGKLASGGDPAVPSLRAIFLAPQRQYDGLWDSGNYLGLIPNSRLQGNCRRNGFNSRANDNGNARVRLGMIGNEDIINSCDTHDSWIGIGGWNGDDRSYSAGNSAEYCIGCDRNIRSRAIVWIR